MQDRQKETGNMAQSPPNYRFKNLTEIGFIWGDDMCGKTDTSCILCTHLYIQCRGRIKPTCSSTERRSRTYGPHPPPPPCLYSTDWKTVSALWLARTGLWEGSACGRDGTARWDKSTSLSISDSFSPHSKFLSSDYGATVSNQHTHFALPSLKLTAKVGSGTNTNVLH
jgi:hypothetical protein